MSFTSVDFPEPETPVTTDKSPSGIATSIFLRLLPCAPRIEIDLPLKQQIAQADIQKKIKALRNFTQRASSDFPLAQRQAGENLVHRGSGGSERQRREIGNRIPGDLHGK